MLQKEKRSRLICMLALFLVCVGAAWNNFNTNLSVLNIRLQRGVNRAAAQMYLPNLTYEKPLSSQGQSWLVENAWSLLPLSGYIEKRVAYEPLVEDEETIAKILENQANDENIVDENGKLIAQTAPDVPVVPAQGTPTLDMSIERLRDFDYLINNFYIVDSSTMIGPEQLNADDLLGRNMKMDQQTGGPKVLIFHTHSQETFVDSVPGDPSTSIVGIGEYLTQLLNAKGISTIHDSGVYDIINGQLDRSNAYENAESAIRPILEANPTIEVVIDLHRDGVADDVHLVTEIGGKQTAKIMYFNGLSRTRTNGDIAYLYNPFIQDNLAFSLQMQIASETLYPGFTRRIYLRGYRYNLHLMPKSLLIEAGAQTNTVEEMRNAMEVLAATLHHVLIG